MGTGMGMGMGMGMARLKISLGEDFAAAFDRSTAGRPTRLYDGKAPRHL